MLNSHAATRDLVAEVSTANIRYNQCILVKDVPILAYTFSRRVCNHTILLTISQTCVEEMDTADRAEASKVVKVNLGEYRNISGDQYHTAVTDKTWTLYHIQYSQNQFCDTKIMCKLY